MAVAVSDYVNDLPDSDNTLSCLRMMLDKEY